MIGDLFLIYGKSRRVYTGIRVFVPMIGDLFLICVETAERQVVPVFVPMIGDLFLIFSGCRITILFALVFVPMIGDLFLMIHQGLQLWQQTESFRPHDWGSFFNIEWGNNECPVYVDSFRPHDWGSFFNPVSGKPDGTWAGSKICGADRISAGFFPDAGVS